MQNLYVDKFGDDNSLTVSLSEWLRFNNSDDKLRVLFKGMSSALKYVHSRGYYVSSFSLDKVDILNNSFDQIRFNELDMLPDDYASRREIVRNNIFNEASLAVGIYSNCLPYLNFNFLKSNFNEFTPFLPESDIPYYRGVIERGSCVYFSDFLGELKKREISALEVDSNEGSKISGGRSLVKSNGHSLSDDNSNYDSIYHQLKNGKETAFISFLVIPALVSIIGVVFTILAWVMSFS